MISRAGRMRPLSIGSACIAMFLACGGKIAGSSQDLADSSQSDLDASPLNDAPIGEDGQGSFSEAGASNDSAASGDSGPTIDRCSQKVTSGACYDHAAAAAYSVASYLPSKVRTPGKCSDTQIEFIVDSCLGGGNCSAAVSGAAACGACVLTVVPAGAPSNTAVGPLIEDQRGSTTTFSANAAGCFDVLTGLAGCGAKVLNRLACSASACCTCNDLDAFEACRVTATSGAEPCVALLDDACRQATLSSGALNTCLAASTTSAENIALGKRVAAAFCK